MRAYHGTSAELDGALICMVTKWNNEEPFDFGLWFTADIDEATYYLQGTEHDKIIEVEISLENAYTPSDEMYDMDEILDAVFQGANVILNAEGPDNIFVNSNRAFTVISTTHVG